MPTRAFIWLWIRRAIRNARIVVRGMNWTRRQLAMIKISSD